MLKKTQSKILFKFFVFFLIALITIFISQSSKGAFSSTSSQSSVKVNNYDEYYNAIKKAMLNYDSSVILRIWHYDKNVYNLDVFKKVLKDNPELQGICTEAKSSVQPSIPFKVTIDFKYSDSRETLKNKEKAVQKKVQEIVEKVIKPDMKDYEKEVALHDYLVNNTKYDKRFFTKDMPNDSNTAYGVLINGIGACQGYSEAMYKLLKAVGIESTVVSGDANDGKSWVAHAWNIVKIGGQYYHLDTTWDDPVTEDGSNDSRYTYFNLTDEQISKNHKWDKSKYPQCSITTYNFQNLNIVEKDKNENVIIPIKSYSDFYKSIRTSLADGDSVLSLRVLNYDANVYDVASVVNKAYDSLSKGGSYSWTYYTDELNNSEYITITFK
ncbi:transglutaminase domain-containing protein [Clostridium sp. OS1-26]|uniref:transglutaminase domain-containing protein n=1 Tax=Clostridium sp. OS1-26 TaxID=3070681 RepID=UPI0027E0DBAF|nr:transglutaminase domain-containing protein [Clostridium sp. OS1-26]WML37334.1 transglutaminase domain-containing protein [Clostridium sp. OS1-26]